jgi:hypothetical protein
VLRQQRNIDLQFGQRRWISGTGNTKEARSLATAFAAKTRKLRCRFANGL